MHIVVGKTPDPDYSGPGGRILGGDPDNPYGRFWIGLGKQYGEPSQISLHGTPASGSLGRTGGRGEIRLGAQDIEDLYDILSLGSRVVVRR